MSAHRLPISRAFALAMWFVLLWVMLWADLSWANLLGGAAVAVVVVLVTRSAATDVEDGTVRIAPIALVHFAGHVLWQLAKSNVALAWEIVTPTNTIAIGTVEVPLRSSSPIVAMAVSNVITLTPGTVTVDVAAEPPSLTIGVLHLHDPAHVIASVRRTEALAVRAFGTTVAREALRNEQREVAP